LETKIYKLSLNEEAPTEENRIVRDFFISVF